LAIVELTARRQGVWLEKTFVWVCRAAIVLPLLILGWLMARVIADGVSRLDWQFLTSAQSRRAADYGIFPALMGSLWLMALTAAIALPIGAGAALYLEEYGRRSKLAGIIEVAIANLAGVPSVIYGILGLGVFVRTIGLGETVISGALTLAILVLPVVIMSTREALRTIPSSLREAALGLGATRWQMVRRVVLPSAAPGILTGAILALSRAIGETAPLVFLGVGAFWAHAPDGLDSHYTALPIQILHCISNPKREFLANAAATIVVLMATLLVLNSIAIVLRNRHQRRL
jgi:phosphate transport system permease protein